METKFKVLTDITKFDMRSHDLVDPTILEPTATYPLWQGEWLVIDGTTGKLQRLASGGLGTGIAYPVIDMEYQYDTRALGRVSVIKSGIYEFLTSVYDASNTPAAIGSPCYVGLVSNRNAIDDDNAGGTQIVARVTATASGGFLRAIRIWT